MTSQLQARTPVFGVRAFQRGNDVVVQASDLGGRGHAHLAIFVAVRKERGRLVPVGSFDRSDDESLKANGIYIDVIEARDSPYLISVPQDLWPARAPDFCVLTLLLYILADGIGGRPRPPRPEAHKVNVDLDAFFGTLFTDRSAGTDARRQDELVKPVLGAVAEALQYDNFDELRPGLIDGRFNNTFRPADGVTFAVASCHYPSDILDRMPEGPHMTRGPADASLLALADVCGSADAPSLLLLAGDQVYIDATAGLFDPKIGDDTFRASYERRGQSRGVIEVMQRLDLRIETMLDDHEIQNNWAPKDPGADSVLQLGVDAYFAYQRGLQRKVVPGHVWRDDIEQGGVTFFLGDTRTEREGRTVANSSTAEIMGNDQAGALRKWLVAPGRARRPKFVLTPSAILPRHLAVARDPLCSLHSDAWDGYPASLYSLLAFACDHELKGLVFLSGDEHICNLVSATITHADKPNRCVFHSIHSSPLYAPYPFANATRDEFEEEDTFNFPDPKRGPYRCVANTEFPDPGAGFALVTTKPSGSTWSLHVRFHDALGLKEKGDHKLRLEFPPA